MGWTWHKWYWNDSEKEEESLVCFVALQDKVTNENFDYVGFYELDNNDHLSYEELSNTFHELHDDMSFLYYKYWAQNKLAILIEIKTFETQEQRLCVFV